MRLGKTIRPGLITSAVLELALACAAQGQPATNEPVIVDRVVAVVNNRAILASDIEKELHVSILEPRVVAADVPNPSSALTRLISRSLIQQQIRREEEQAAVPTEDQVQARLQELREKLPACVRANCASDAGWTAFLSENELTADQVVNYLRSRLEFLNYIENRFQQGIRISQEEIEKYYRESLLPQYPAGQPVPTLESVTPRIQEILLQQQVNSLFMTWLDNLRKQGDVEILDPSLAADGNQKAGGVR